MLTGDEEKILASVFPRQEETCPYCKLPLYLSDTSIRAHDGTLVDVWECMRDNRTFSVPAGCSVSVLKKLHITIQVGTIGMYGENDVGDDCMTFHTQNYSVFCTLCRKEISSGWEICSGNAVWHVCSEHITLTHKRG